MKIIKIGAFRAKGIKTLDGETCHIDVYCNIIDGENVVGIIKTIITKNRSVECYTPIRYLKNGAIVWRQKTAHKLETLIAITAEAHKIFEENKA